jgi:stress-induced-phosphoprotein 1
MTTTAEELKAQGNAAFTAGKFEDAVALFSQAIAVDPQNHVLWSNRSGAYCSLKRYEEALSDAERVTELRPDWPKGWSRKAAAHQGLRQWQSALKAWQKAMELDPQGASSSSHQDAMTRCFQAFLAEAQGRFPSTPSPPTESTTHADSAKQDIKEMDEQVNEQEVKESKGDKAEELDDGAERFKLQGNELYKQRRFDEALELYRQASNLEPTNVHYILNQSAVLLEMGREGECLEVCQRAADLALETHAGYETMARIYGRMGNAYGRLGDLEQAMYYYSKSLTENRTADVQAKLKETEKLLQEQRKRQYHDPAVAEAERARGNDLFKAGKYAEAVDAYSEAIKRDEQDPRAYANRAACYLKLGAVVEGLRDCQQCLRLDPTFIKAYTRRCALLLMKQAYGECLEAVDEALQRLPSLEPAIRKELEDYRFKALVQMQAHTSQNQEDPEAALKDPEVQRILADPVMQSILQQMQRDPAALKEHMRNPGVAHKIRKLVAAGVIRTRAD